MGRQSEQLEHQADQTRAQLANTISELRGRMSPGQFVDELMDFSGGGAASEFARNLGRDVQAHPLPLALVGAGLAWMLIRNAAPGRGDGLSAIGDRLSDAAGSVSERAKAAAGSLSDAVGGMKERLSDTASQAGTTAASIKDAASESLQSASDTTSGMAQKLMERSGSWGRSASDSGRSFVQFCQDQPMIMAGLGIAAGALIGALLPVTETENRLMGETSDSVKQSAKELASSTYEEAKSRASEAAQTAADASRPAPAQSAISESHIGEGPITHH